jgi:hypothetical protein
MGTKDKNYEHEYEITECRHRIFWFGLMARRLLYADSNNNWRLFNDSSISTLKSFIVFLSCFFSSVNEFNELEEVFQFFVYLSSLLNVSAASHL